MIFLSVIITAHNSEKTLHSMFRSLLMAIGGSNKEIEIIIMNDSSIDDTQSIIDFWKKKFFYIISKCVDYSNIGKVRNSAISLVSGKYIMMLDSDDQLKPRSLSDAVNCLKIYDPDMLLTHLIEVNNINRITNLWKGFKPSILKNKDAIRCFLLHKNFQAHLIGQFIHRNLYINNPIPSLICYEDFAIFPNLLMQAERIFYQHQGHYYHIKRCDSLSNNLNEIKIKILIECTLQMENIFPKKYQHLINCHWFDIYKNYNMYLNNDQLNTVLSRINNLFSLSFFMSRDVRLNYKKQVIQEKWKFKM